MRLLPPSLAVLAIGLAIPGAAAWAQSHSAQAKPPAARPAIAAAAPQADAAILAPFHRALSDLQAGRRQRVVVLQVGDSHTAADHFTQRLREHLQHRFGDAGRGHLPVAYAYPQYNPYGVRLQKSGNWITMNSRREDDAGPYGVSGYRLIGNDAGDSISLEADLPFDEAELEILAQPGGGGLILRVDGAVVGEVSTAANTVEMRRVKVPLRGAGQSLALSPRGNGSVELLAWSIWQRLPGVALVSHGVPGASVGVMERFDPQIVAQEMAVLAPSLVIVAFGTNEGFSLAFDAASYRRQFADRLAAWKRLAPNAAIVVVGPPNALRLPDYCATNAEQRDRLACAPTPAKTTAEYYALMSQHSRLLCRWHEPTPETEIRAIQRQEAIRQGAYFWDWGQFPAGPCGMDAWVRHNPPMVHKDRVHMKPEGYAVGADALYKELMRSYRPK